MVYPIRPLVTLSIALLCLTSLWIGLSSVPGFSRTIAVGGASQGQTAQSPVLPVQAVATTKDLIQQGRDFYTAGRFADAVAVWQEAATQLEQQGDRLNQAMVLSNLGLAYQQLGQIKQASTAIAGSLDLLKGQQTQAQSAKEYRQILAQALTAQGSLHLATGKPEAALKSWEQAAQAYSAIADTDGVLRSQINQAQALKALGLYRRAFALLTDVNKALLTQRDSITKVAGLRSLGNAWRLIGNADESRQVLKQSLAIAQSPQSQATSEISSLLLSLGNTARAQQDSTAALDFYQQAAATATSSTLKLQALVNQLSVLLEQRPIPDVRPVLTDIQAQLVGLPPSHTAIYTRVNVAQNLMRQKDQGERFQNELPSDRQNIAQLLATAIQQARSLRDARAESHALGTLGHLYERNKQWADARTVTEQALAIAQSILAPDIAYQWQWQLGRILNAQKQQPGAIAAYTQAWTTLGTLRNDLVAINTDIQFSFREKVEPVYRELVDLLTQPDAQGGEPSPANLSRARSVIESLQLAELDNFFKEACLTTTPVPLDKIDPKAAIIYPIILEKRLEVVLRLPNQKELQHYATPVTRNTVRTTLENLRDSLSPYSLFNRVELSKQVYTWLIPPEADLKGIETLVFVLDGELRNFPMAALYDGSKFLIEKYAIALSPGLQLLNPRRLTDQKLQMLTGGLTAARQEFEALPKVADELKLITQAVPGSKRLLDQELTKDNLIQQLNRVPFNVVHLATHGQFSSDADKTFILTWDDRIKVKQLSALLRDRDSAEITPLELLVLSACQTASGDTRAALGLAGVAVRSGARSTLATLWSVSDEAASTLMPRFYQELTVPGTTKAQALQRAQLSLLKDPKFQLPYYWAPFVLVGNWL